MADLSDIRTAILTAGTALVTAAFFTFFRRHWIFKRVNFETSHHGGELVAQVLTANGVKFLFTLCGGHISPILTASEKCSIRVVDVRHEANAVFAADAVARLSGSVGVVAVTAGPGVTNTLVAVKNAQMAESPIIILAGAAAGLLKGRGSLQDIEQLAVFRTVCKFTARVNQVKDIVPIMVKAFYEAQSGTPGPVLVEFPIDTLYPCCLVKQHMNFKPNPKTLMQWITQWYMRFYLRRLFSGAFPMECTSGEHSCSLSEHAAARIPPLHIRSPSSRQVSSIARLLTAAKRPLILVGSQAMLPPISAEDTAENIKMLRIPVYVSGMARGLLGRSHPFGFRHARRVALREADVVILAGVICDFRLDYGRSLNRKAKIGIINRSKEQLYKNSDIFWRPTVAIQADVGTTLTQLVLALDSVPEYAELETRIKPWIAALTEREEAREAGIRECSLTAPAMHNNPLAILTRFDAFLKKLDESGTENILIGDGGDFVGTAAYVIRPPGPLTWLDPGPFGTLGVGGGFALGAKLCRPKANVWVLYGDGAAGYSIAEWDSLNRHKAPAVAIIGNDAAWSQVARDQVTFFNSSVACTLRYTPYEIIGTAYATESTGEKGDVANLQGAFLITKSNLDEFPSVLAKSIDITTAGKPVVINCLLGNSGFRDGSISV